MSSLTWAAIVKKPIKEIPVIEEDTSPMNVIVPEPPAPSVPVKQLVKELPEVQLLAIEKRRQDVIKEIKHKEEKFYNSYAYTKYMKDINDLKGEKFALDEKERLLILMNGKYTNQIKDLMNRVEAYIKPIPHYSKMTYYIVFPKETETFILNNKMSIIINEELYTDTGNVNKLHIDFLVESEELSNIIDMVLGNLLKGFVRDHRPSVLI
jgi:predicted thioredoxin/glutaredoxin